MGTNYYLYNILDDLQGDTNALHIGKCSAGWVFALQVYLNNPDLPKNIHDWRLLWNKPGNYIQNEYGRNVTPAELEHIIANTKDGKRATKISDYFVSHCDQVSAEYFNVEFS